MNHASQKKKKLGNLNLTHVQDSLERQKEGFVTELRKLSQIAIIVQF